MHRTFVGTAVVIAVVATTATPGFGTSAPAEVWNPCAAAAPVAPGAETGSAAEEAELGEFGPLAASPSLTIELPAVPIDTDPETPPYVDVQRVAGGLLIALRAPGRAGFSLNVVNDDGSVRWRVCADGFFWQADAAPDGASAVVVSAASGDVDAPDRVELYDLATGAVRADLTADVAAIAGGTAPVATTPDGVFFSGGWGTPITNDGRMARVDLRTEAVTPRALPPLGEGTEIGTLAFEVTPTGYLVARGLVGDQSVQAALVQGAWTTDLNAVASVVGPHVVVVPGVDQLFPSRERPDLSPVWQREDLALWSGEGFLLGQTEGTAIVKACPTGDSVTCDRPTLVGLDLESGATRWELDDAWFAAEWGDGVAIVGGPAGYRMIDAASGATVGDTTWPDGTFAQGCCGEGEVLFTQRLGGIVVAVDGRSIEVYYPEASAPPPTTVTL